MEDFIKGCLVWVLIIALVVVCIGLCVGYIGLRGTYMCEMNPDLLVSFGPFNAYSSGDNPNNGKWTWTDSHDKHSIRISENSKTVDYDFYQVNNYSIIYINHVKYVRKTLNYVNFISKKFTVKFVYKNEHERVYKIKMGQTMKSLPLGDNNMPVRWVISGNENEFRQLTTHTRIWNDMVVNVESLE